MGLLELEYRPLGAARLGIQQTTSVYRPLGTARVSITDKRRQESVGQLEADRLGMNTKEQIGNICMLGTAR